MTVPFDRTNLRHRVASSVVLIPVVMLAISWGGLLYDAVVFTFMMVGLYEWLRIVAPEASDSLKTAFFVALFLTLWSGVAVSAMAGAELGGVLTALLYFYAKAVYQKEARWIAFGLPYLALGGLALIDMRVEPHSEALTVYLIAVVVGTDVGAYVAGRLIGGPKLLPSISPKKTWAGLFGGMAFAALLGYGVAAWFGATSIGGSLWMALLLAIVSQAGDFFESYVKRRYGVKDSGNIIPGHGGVLDRIDGLLFAAVFLAVVSHWIVVIG